VVGNITSAEAVRRILVGVRGTSSCDCEVEGAEVRCLAECCELRVDEVEEGMSYETNVDVELADGWRIASEVVDLELFGRTRIDDPCFER
jgi:hypothetical protein